MKIFKFGAEILRSSSTEVGAITDELIDLMDNMIETMILAPGIGLAAPQVGWDQRLFVMNIHEEEFDKIINPKILETGGMCTFHEGCLSFPQLFADVVRPEWIRVQYINEDGEEVVQEKDGLWARCFLHEFDHLEGKLFVDYLSKKQLKQLREELSRIEDEGLLQNQA
jgi:peptide deformylase